MPLVIVMDSKREGASEVGIGAVGEAPKVSGVCSDFKPRVARVNPLLDVVKLLRVKLSVELASPLPLSVCCRVRERGRGREVASLTTKPCCLTRYPSNGGSVIVVEAAMVCSHLRGFGARGSRRGRVCDKGWTQKTKEG